MLDHCIKREIDEAIAIVMKLYKLGYASEDIIQNIFRVAKNHTAAEYIKERIFFYLFTWTIFFILSVQTNFLILGIFKNEFNPQYIEQQRK